MTQFGQNPSFNSYHFSGANTLNQEAIGAVSITGPGRVTDLNVFWAGDGQSGFTGYNIMWNNGGAIELQSVSYGALSGSESVGGQTLMVTSTNYFYTTTHNVNVGFFRDKTKSSVVSVNTGGTDGITLTTSSNAPQSMSGASSFNSQYGGAGKGAMRAYGDYVPSSVFVKRGGVWNAISIDVKRSGVMGAAKVWVRRAGAWVQLAMVPVNDWGAEIEKKIKILWTDGSWDDGIIRDGELGIVRFGNYDPRNEPQSKRLYAVIG